jgi:DNA-binding response OmpR family regulator
MITAIFLFDAYLFALVPLEPGQEMGDKVAMTTLYVAGAILLPSVVLSQWTFGIEANFFHGLMTKPVKVKQMLQNCFYYYMVVSAVALLLTLPFLFLEAGIGLKEEKTDRLFERFYQGNNSSGLHIEGTGIGLNLCKAFVEMHGGKIKAYNRTDGIKGSCFEVSIPLGNSHLQPGEILEEEDKKEQEITKKKVQANRNFNILIVDDDSEIAQYIKTELSDWYRFEHACNGKEGLKMLLTGKYDLVISDVMMPEMDGITMLKNIKSNSNISDIPVILLTSKSEVEHRLEGLRRGADAFLAKPFDMEELHILIDNLVDNVRRIRGKYSGAQGQKAKIEQIQVKGNNDALMERVMKYINAHLADPDLNVEKLTEEVGISRAQLHRKLKEIAGVSAGEFIRNLRLEQAARLIEEGQINITQVAYSVGFNNQTHFSTVFKKHYGMSPSEYAETKRNEK